MIVGLTGGIASGKSTVSTIFNSLGVKIADADKIAKEISQREDVKKEILNIFGKDVFSLDNQLDRSKLKEIVFSDRNKLAELNGIIHPKIMEEFKKIKANSCKNDIIIFDIPLLFETGMDKLCDKVIVVFIDKEEQIKRIEERDKIERDLCEKIIASQLSLEDKLKRADIIIDNSGSLEELGIKVKKIYMELKGD